MTDGASVTVPPQITIPIAEDFTALRAFDSDVQINGQPVLVNSSIDAFFRWDATSFAVDDNSTVIRPTDRTSLQAGRWIAVGSYGTSSAAAFAGTRTAAIATSYDAAVSAVMTTGYATAGKGGALYKRKTTAPTVAPTYTSRAWFQSADGAYWEISEPVLNPYMFGAVADGIWSTAYGGVVNLASATDDTLAIQAMFDLITQTQIAHVCDFQGGVYYCRSGATLPSVAAPGTIVINGGGGCIATNQSNTTLLSRLPASQAAAITLIDRSAIDIRDMLFYGDAASGTIGMQLAAIYGASVENCQFYTCAYGFVGTFSLAGSFRNLRFVNCLTQAFKLRSGAGDPSGSIVWSGASESNSASNVNLVENCRVFNTPTAVCSYAIYASDSVRMIGCISEGQSAAISYDIDYNYMASPTVKIFTVEGFHCENPGAAVNFRIRATGNVTISDVKTTYPVAFCDASGSTALIIKIINVPYLGDNPPVSGNNPNQRLFYHTNGGGYAGTQSGNSSGSVWEFENWGMTLSTRLLLASNWENATLPFVERVTGYLPSNAGYSDINTGATSLQGSVGEGVSVDSTALFAPTTVAGLTAAYAGAPIYTVLTATDNSVATAGSTPAAGGGAPRLVFRKAFTGAVLADWIVV